MSLKALDAVLEATHSGPITWKKTDPDRYETLGEPRVSIQFHYPQVGGETTTGADIEVVSLGGVVLSFFSGSEGMEKVRQILRESRARLMRLSKTSRRHNKRPRVDAGWPLLFAFSRSWPRATQAERST